VGAAIVLTAEGSWWWIILAYLDALIVAGGWSALLARWGLAHSKRWPNIGQQRLPFSSPVSSLEPQSVSRSSAASGVATRDPGFLQAVSRAQPPVCSVPVS